MGKNIYVGNLPFQTTSDDLLSWCGDYGTGAGGPGKSRKSPAVSEAGPERGLVEIRWKAPPPKAGKFYGGPQTAAAWLGTWKGLYQDRDIGEADRARIVGAFRGDMGRHPLLAEAPDSALHLLLAGKVRVEVAEGDEVIRFRLTA